MKKNENRSGSALIVVLGMLAVLMLMAVAFSVFMRTERSGVTNLRHSLVARQTMQTAISHVMESIDRSFVNPTNNWPIPNWEQPFLSSASVWPYYQSSNCPAANRGDNAKILTEEISKHLTPSQLALARNAQVQWATIKSSVDSSASLTSDKTLSEDKIVGRYAFIALNTTGLLDMNLAGSVAGTAAERLKDYGTNSANFQIADTTFIKANSGFLSSRDKYGPFTSYADMWRNLGANPYKYKDNKEIDPDLFSGFSTSLDELAPDGSMKIPLGVALKSDAQKIYYAKLVYPAFQKILPDSKELSFGAPLTRAQLATQSLIDYLDEDVISSGGCDTGSLANYLNYPCTEPVPLVSHVIAPIEINFDGLDQTAANHMDWFRKYTVNVSFQGEAQLLTNGAPANTSANTYSLTIQSEGAFKKMDLSKLWGDCNRTGADGWYYDVDKAALSNALARTATANTVKFGHLNANIDTSFTVKEYPESLDPATQQPNFKCKTFTRAEFENLPEPLYLPVYLTAKVYLGSTVVQQVPAPSLAATKLPNDDYRIRVDPQLYSPAGQRSGAAEVLEYGWAFCVDPRFAFDTVSMIDPQSVPYCYWLNNFQAHEVMTAGITIAETAEEVVAHELAGDMDNGMLSGNCLSKDVFFAKTTSSDVVKMIEGFTPDEIPIYPDLYHAPSKAAVSANKLFIKTDDYATGQTALKSWIANKPMVSVGELGNLLVGPWETLSLFYTFRPDGGKDFHRAVDYFSTGEARYPTFTDIGSQALSTFTKEHVPAIHGGRVNLNAQRLVTCTSQDAKTGVATNSFNNEPLAAVLTGLSLDDSGSFLTYADAFDISDEFYAEVDLPADQTAGGDIMIRRLSDFGTCNVSSNSCPVLNSLYANHAAEIKCDANRESVIRNSIAGMTTRGQTYLVILRADAYSPKYGSTSAGDGTTLASTHAIVELWRDSEPARTPDGRLFPIGTTTPTHNWYVRSVRWF